MGPNPHPTLEVDLRRRVYIERFASSVEAVSFDDVLTVGNALAGMLKRPTLAIGTHCEGDVESYRRYRQLLRLAAQSPLTSETWFHPATPRSVRSALEAARIARRPVRLYYGDVATGRDLMVLTGTVGYIGRRGTVLQFPVLCPSAESTHGSRIHDNALVRIEYVHDHIDLWRHPRYHLPRLDRVHLPDGRVRLVVDGTRDLDFDDEAEVEAFRRYVAGQRHVEPRCVRFASPQPPVTAVRPVHH